MDRCLPIARGTFPLRISLLLVLLALPSVSAADSLYTRNLACEQQRPGRATEICRAMEQALEWGWTGHAIISPGYRLSTEGMRDVYCRAPITAKDTAVLVDMALDSELASGMRQAQINNGARALLALLGQQALDSFPAAESFPDERRRLAARHLRESIALDIAETSTSVFSPSHRYYILKGGCPRN